MPNKSKEMYPKLKGFKAKYRNLVIGKSPKPIANTLIKGELTSYKKGQVNNLIKVIAEECEAFKIGVSGDLGVRMDYKDYREASYNKVQEVYRSKSENRVIDYEVELIKKFQKLYPEKCKNKSTTKVGSLTTYDSHYRVYVVYS